MHTTQHPSGKTLKYRIGQGIGTLFIGICLFAIALNVALPSGSSAASEPVTLAPVADSQVKNSSPNTNYGDSTNVAVEADPTLHSYLRFQVSGLGQGSVSEARLRLYLSGANVEQQANLTIYATSSDWDEMKLVWNNRPALGQQIVSLPPASMLGARWIEINLGQAVTGDGTYNFVLASDAAERVYFRSRESSQPPALVLTLAGGVAPTAAATQPPAATATATQPPAATATKTQPPAATATKTAVPPTATKTAVPPTATKTTLPPTATKTTVPPTATKTAVPPTATKTTVPPTATKTTVPPTATKTAVPPTATKTAVPPTATKTAVPPTATRTPAPAPTQTPIPPTPNPSVPGKGIWISRDELLQRPISGPAWEQIKAAADGNLGTPNISDQDSDHDVNTLAVALVYARTGNTSYRTKAADAIMAAIETENGGRTLALGRNLVSYVIAADLIDLKSYDAAKDQQFRTWLAGVRTEVLDGKTLISTHEERPNNWGTHAGASRIAADLYLGDKTDLDRAAKVFKGWLGDRASYAGFEYGDLSWQADPNNPVGVNPAGSRKDGHSIDGAIPDDMRRGCSFQWPPCETNYAWGALEGALVQNELLQRAGYPSYSWENQAMRRAVQYLYDLDREVGGWWADGDDEWMVPLANYAYGTNFPAPNPASPGKNMGWTDWTHMR